MQKINLQIINKLDQPGYTCSDIAILVNLLQDCQLMLVPNHLSQPTHYYFCN